MKKIKPSILYALIGFTAGLICSIIGTLIQLYKFNQEISWYNIIDLHTHIPAMWVINIAPFVLTIISAMIGLREEKIKDIIVEETELKESFERFYPNQLINLLDKKSITDIHKGESTEKHFTILFSDIRNFTTISEQLSSKDVFDFLQSYFSDVSPIMIRNQGFIENFIGDAILAIFPNNVNDAVQASNELLRYLQGYNIKINNTTSRFMDIGIGLHTGPVTLGTMGSDDRLKTTVIGDTVNQAARMEKMTKKFQAKFLLSDSAYAELNGSNKVFTRKIGWHKVKGKEKIITFYENFQSYSITHRRSLIEIKPFYEQALQCITDKKFKEAIANLEICIKKCPTDYTSIRYLSILNTKIHQK